jgi:hypothetical protein
MEHPAFGPGFQRGVAMRQATSWLVIVTALLALLGVAIKASAKWFVVYHLSQAHTSPKTVFPAIAASRPDHGGRHE